MANDQINASTLCVIICTVFSLVSSITLPYMVTNKPPRHTKYTLNSTMLVNGTKISNFAATTATKGVVLYKVTASNGATCILLKVDGLIEVYFKSHIGKEQVDTYMPEDALVEGTCKNEDSASMKISWEGYSMIWNFAKTPGGERWYVSQIDLTVSTALERYHSVKAYVLPAKSFRLVHDQMIFPTPVGKSYACEESTLTLELPEGEYNPASLSGQVYLRTFQLQPFMYKGSNFGPAFDCNMQVAFKDETVPIAVGSTLAIAVLATVTGYGVFRYFKIKKVQYNTME
ncbi:hypothetical protein FQR65_LT10330 [Abscondita terminalis]|nr:hypothetical protein FQR65_LT10330 [Abscondita terminalis]